VRFFEHFFAPRKEKTGVEMALRESRASSAYLSPLSLPSVLRCLENHIKETCLLSLVTKYSVYVFRNKIFQLHTEKHVA